MKRDNSIPYVGLEVELVGCVERGHLDSLMVQLKAWLADRLKPDFDGDIDISLMNSAGLEE